MVHDSDDASMLVDAWVAAREAVSAEGIEQPIKLAVLGPWALAVPLAAALAAGPAPRSRPRIARCWARRPGCWSGIRTCCSAGSTRAPSTCAAPCSGSIVRSIALDEGTDERDAQPPATESSALMTFHYWHPFADMRRVSGHELILRCGEGCWIEDADRHPYLDATAGLWYCNVGHGRREIAEVAAAQLARRYWDALGHPERRLIVSREHAYHGMHAFGTGLGGIP